MVPFLKWAGGKRWLFSAEFIVSLPPYTRYIEPFLGGGAGFFSLRPNRAVISDLNSDLIDLYETVRDEPVALQTKLAIYQKLHDASNYYEVRSNIPEDKIGRSARTLYLNRTCWNGLYRKNKKGEFNVPIGTKSSVLLPSDNFLEMSKALERASIKCCDFEIAIEAAGSGDLIFADPPYTVKHNMNGFVKYNESIFGWQDQERLAEALKAASKRGAGVILTNADHESVRELYKDFGHVKSLPRSTVISGKALGRGQTSELLVTL